MVVQITTDTEKITMDNVTFVNETINNFPSISITTKDGDTTEVTSPNSININIFTDNGVLIEEKIIEAFLTKSK